MKDFNFKIPQNIQFGMGSLKKLPEILAENHSDNILLVSDRGLEKIGVKSDELKQALLQGGSPAKPDELRSRFDTFLNDRCKGKDSTKLRFVIE